MDRDRLTGNTITLIQIASVTSLNTFMLTEFNAWIFCSISLLALNSPTDTVTSIKWPEI